MHAHLWSSVQDLASAALSTPLTSLIVAAAVALVILAWRRDRPAAGARSAAPDSVVARYAPEIRTLRILAVGIVIVAVVEFTVRIAPVRLPEDMAAWRFAAPVVCAAVGLAAVGALVAGRGSGASEEPVVPTQRRGWRAFSTTRDLAVVLGVLLVLVSTTLLAGLASSADTQGRYVWLEVPVPNLDAVDPVRVTFFGWAYGVPVLIGSALLVLAVGFLLRANAVRPFIRPDTVAGENSARRRIAAGAVRIATAALLIAMAGAWRMIAQAGSVSGLEIMGVNDGQPYELSWRYAEFAGVIGWCAPAVEIGAFVLLLLFAVGPRARGRLDSAGAPELAPAAAR